ncbi:MAG TPA: HigA family addiction module antitoxin [Ensifer sp.]|nr:HigA family addiction module antitoxin [Ensifer sp.]
MNQPIHVGMKPPHVGSFIRDEILEPLDLTVTKTAEILDVRRATLSDLINEKAGLSAEMAFRIEKAFNVKMDTLLNMQTWYDTYVMRAQGDKINVRPYIAD